MYAVGDKVVHPGYGPGVIRDIDRREMIGEPKRYYVIDMQDGGATLMTPVAKADEVGLRLAISKASIKKLFQSLSESPHTLSEDFKERQTEIEEQLKTGDIYITAKVLRDLAWHGREHNLTKRDTELLQRAEDLIASEVALVEGTDVKVAIEQLQATLAEAVRQASTD
jgi:CarD family transcriptional regulator